MSVNEECKEGQEESRPLSDLSPRWASSFPFQDDDCVDAGGASPSPHDRLNTLKWLETDSPSKRFQQRASVYCHSMSHLVCLRHDM